MTSQTAEVVTQQEDPKESPTTVVGVVFVALFIAIVLALRAYYNMAEESEVTEKVITRTSEQVTALQETQAEELASYRWIDAQAGVVGIPVERAMDLVVTELAREAR